MEVTQPAKVLARVPLATRCFVVLRALGEHGPLTLHDLADAITHYLIGADDTLTGLVFDDLRTMDVFGWIEPYAGDSRRYVLTETGRAVLGECTPRSTL
jgi:hypothetical protein